MGRHLTCLANDSVCEVPVMNKEFAKGCSFGVLLSLLAVGIKLAIVPLVVVPSILLIVFLVFVIAEIKI